jgi:hypothetical protein
MNSVQFIGATRYYFATRMYFVPYLYHRAKDDFFSSWTKCSICTTEGGGKEHEVHLLHAPRLISRVEDALILPESRSSLAREFCASPGLHFDPRSTVRVPMVLVRVSDMFCVVDFALFGRPVALMSTARNHFDVSADSSKGLPSASCHLSLVSVLKAKRTFQNLKDDWKIDLK